MLIVNAIHREEKRYSRWANDATNIDYKKRDKISRAELTNGFSPTIVLIIL